MPVICAIIPGDGDTSWSTETTSPGLDDFFPSVQFFLLLCLHCFLVDLAKRHAVQAGG